MANVDASLKEIEFALDTLKLDGIGLLSNYAGVYLGDPAFDAVFAELNRRKALVFVHPTSPPHFDSLSQGIAAPFLEFPFDTTRVAANLIKSGTMDRNRDLRLILTHGGGTIPYIYMRLTIAAGTDAERALSDLVAATSPTQTGALASIVPTDHMTLGFDFPFMNPQFIAPAIEALATGKFTAEQLQDICSRNALALFPGVAARLTAKDRV
jgi:predicted TIM-barrel fold metal-dependent hydrolase